MNDQTMEPTEPSTLQAAVDEVSRELNVRRRCFPRWVQDGRVSKTDAQDRINRLASALGFLQHVQDNATN